MSTYRTLAEGEIILETDVWWDDADSIYRTVQLGIGQPYHRFEWISILQRPVDKPRIQLRSERDALRRSELIAAIWHNVEAKQPIPLEWWEEFIDLYNEPAR